MTPTLCVLIGLAWLVLAVLAIALASMAARADREDERRHGGALVPLDLSRERRRQVAARRRSRA